MKILILVVFSTIGQTLFAQNTGIGTPTPLKKLHVNGDLQVTGELNMGGTGNKEGDPGTTGQILMSNGKGKTPFWYTLDIPKPIIDDSYKLSMVYKIMLDKAELKNSNEGVSFPGINLTINKSNNFILANFQSVTCLITGNETAESSIAYDYQIKIDNNPLMKAPVSIISKAIFTSSTMNNSYQFVKDNLSIGSHVVELSTVRYNYTGNAYNKSLFVNQVESVTTPGTPEEQKGLLTIYVYER